MAVAKRQAREKPAKIEQKKVRGPERRLQVEERAHARGREKEGEHFGSSFYMFFFHLGLPYANWA